MNGYNKVMLYFWFGLFVISTITITYMGFKEGFSRWYSYYLFSGVSLLMYFVRKWMIKRMNKHLEYLANQKK
jgi:hypothetical protein